MATKMLRVIRGVVGTAVMWGLAWSALSIQTLLHFLNSPPSGMSGFHAVVTLGGPAWVSCFSLGALAGAAFATLLAVTSRRVANFRGITLTRAGVLGACTTVGLMVAIGGAHVFLGRTLFLTLIGSATSVAAFAIARRAPEGDALVIRLKMSRRNLRSIG